MAEQLYTMAGTRIFIGDAPMNSNPELTPEDFDGVTWIEMGGLYNVGELGGEQTINEFELINETWMRKSKSTRNGGTMTNQFVPMALDPGQAKFREAIESCRPYPFRVERGADCAPESEVTVAETTGLITWTGHGFVAGQPVMFDTGEGGTLPTELSADTIYYVVGDGLTANQFGVAATAGGTPIATTAASTGTVLLVAPPAGMTDMFLGLATDGARTGGAKNDLYLRSYNIAVDGPIVTV